MTASAPTPERPALSSPAPAVTGQRLVRNGLVNLLASVGGLAISFLLVPVMVDGLGTEEFGVWALALTFTVASGYLTLTDLGLQQSAVRLMADARRVGDEVALRELFSTALAALAGIAAVVAPVLVLVADELVSVFTIDADLRDAAALTFQIIAAQVLVDLPAQAPRAVLESDQRFLTLRVIDLGRAVVQAAAIVVLLALGHGLVAIAVASLATSALTGGAYLLAAVRTPGGVRPRPGAVRRARARELLSFAAPLFALRILSTIYRQMDKVILAVALTVTAVAHYEIASRAQAGMVVLMGAGGAVVLPAATVIRTELDRLRELVVRGTSYSMALFLPPIVVVLVYAGPLVEGWVGSGNDEAVPLVRLFFLWLALGSFDAVVTTILTSLGRLKPLVWLTTAWVACNLALSIALVGPLGASGVLVATVVTYAPLIVAFTLLCLREVGLGRRQWARRVLLPHAPALVVQCGLCLALYEPLSHLPNLLSVAVAAAVTWPISVLVYLRVGLPPHERTRFIGTLRSALPAVRRPGGPGVSTPA